MRVSRLAVPLIAIVVTATGCTNVVDGTAKPVDTTGPNGQRTVDLESMLLSVDEINSIMGADDIEMVESTEDMLDHSAQISDEACLGSLYNAEEVVYEDSGWTGVVDQVLTQPIDDPDHWVEQTVVRFTSSDDASALYQKSKTEWQECVGQGVSVFDQGYEFHWEFDGLTIDDNTISQTALQIDSDGWTCQHALRAVSNFVVEASTCGTALGDEAVEIVEGLANKVG